MNATGDIDAKFSPMNWCLSGLKAPVPPYVNKTFFMGFSERLALFTFCRAVLERHTHLPSPPHHHQQPNHRSRRRRRRRRRPPPLPPPPPPQPMHAPFSSRRSTRSSCVLFFDSLSSFFIIAHASLHLRTYLGVTWLGIWLIRLHSVGLGTTSPRQTNLTTSTTATPTPRRWVSHRPDS